MGVAGCGGCTECESTYLFACAARQAQWAVARCCFYKYLRILIKIQLVDYAPLRSVSFGNDTSSLLPLLPLLPLQQQHPEDTPAQPGPATWAPLSE